RRRILDPARRVQGEDGDLDHRLPRRCRGRGLRPARVHHLDAQPRGTTGELPGDRPVGCGGGRPDRRREHRARVLSPVRAQADGDLGERRGGRGRSADRDGGRTMSGWTYYAPLAAATGHIKGPHIDWWSFSPFLALTVGALVVLLVGLLRSEFIR